MKSLWAIVIYMVFEERTALIRGLLLSIAVLLAGIALLGLSGWFITAASIAGLAGIGIAFDVFRPSAGVRFLALGRTAARYGERLLTHDATLRALARLRVQVLRHLSFSDFATMQKMRSEELLNRMTSDIEALDGLLIRLIFPILSGAITLAITFLALWYLVDFAVSIFVTGTLALFSALILFWLGRKTYSGSAEASIQTQIFREKTVDHIRGRGVLAFAGQLDSHLENVIKVERSARQARLDVADQEILAGTILGMTSSFISAGTLAIAGLLALSEVITPALAALAFFATLAVLEIVMPLRRSVAEIGRMQDAAARIAKYSRAIPNEGHGSNPTAIKKFNKLDIDQLQIAAAQRLLLTTTISFRLEPGEALAITGKSGAGKSTLLNVIAGLTSPSSGTVNLNGKPIAEYSDFELRRLVGYLPQRSALLSGTVRESITLGATANDEQIWDLLEAVALKDVVLQKGGLDTLLGETGAGLSGGQKKRLALARVLLRKPGLILLDEVTEGLDEETARTVLSGIRGYLPEAAILMAAHRNLETDFADQILVLS